MFNEEKPDLVVVPCVPKGELIHCNPELKDIAEVTIGDRVLSHDGEYHTVTKVYRRSYNDDLTYIKPRNHLGFLVTPEHPVYAMKVFYRRGIGQARRYKNLPEPQWIKAKDLRKGDQVAFPILRRIEDKETINLNLIKQHPNAKPILKNIQITPDLLRCFGLYISEGSKKKAGIRFTFSIKETLYADFILKTIKTHFNIKGFSYLHRRSLVVEFRSTDLRRIFVEWFGSCAPQKKIPSWILVLPPRKKISLLRGLFEGDGTIGKMYYRFTTTSKVLALQMQQIVHQLTILPSLHEVKVNPKSYAKRKQYELTISGINGMVFSTLLNEPIENINRIIKPRESSWIYQDCVWSSIDKIESRPFSGEVFNLAVEDTNSYVCNSTVVHNCDRIEMLACASAAFEMGIPIAHFHAGDLGAGIRDDSIRMAISRLSSIMFCETEEAKNFLVQSGEESWRVNIVGSTAFDGIEIPSKKDFLKKYKLPETYSILLYHPDPYATHQDLEITTIWVNYCTAQNAVDQLILMYPNGDPGSDQIIEKIETYKDDKRFRIIPSFEKREDYLAAIKYCHMLIGNSSSIFFEAPYFDTKTQQIGERNKTRLKPKQIIDGGSKRIAKIIAELDLSPHGRDILLRKRYYLLEFQLRPQLY